jgi:hypothetical protein
MFVVFTVSIFYLQMFEAGYASALFFHLCFPCEQVLVAGGDVVTYSILFAERPMDGADWCR